MPQTYICCRGHPEVTYQVTANLAVRMRFKFRPRSTGGRFLRSSNEVELFLLYKSTTEKSASSTARSKLLELGDRERRGRLHQKLLCYLKNSAHPIRHHLITFDHSGAHRGGLESCYVHFHRLARRKIRRWDNLQYLLRNAHPLRQLLPPQRLFGHCLRFAGPSGRIDGRRGSGKRTGGRRGQESRVGSRRLGPRCRCCQRRRSRGRRREPPLGWR